MHTFYENDPITPLVQKYITEQQVKQEEGKEIKNPYLSFLLFFGIGFCLVILGYFSSSTITIIFGAVFMLVAILGFVQVLIQRRVAMMMNTKANLQEENNIDNDDRTNTAQQFTKELHIPPFQLDVYEQNELPGVSYALNQNITEEKNIFNSKPLRIFYFSNFYSQGALLNKTSGGFQRHGPVFFLGSPRDIGFGKFWQMFSIKKIVQKLLLNTPEQLGEAINKVSLKPLPPKTKGQLTENYFEGAYPTNVFYCTDAIWQKCVALLFAKTDCSIIDASDYTKERAGLQWEIGQIINHIATEDFVVLINGKTDIVALGESFRNSWKRMNPNSPNNKDRAASVRFIFHQLPDHEMGKIVHTNIFYEKYHQEALSNDRIIELMMQSK